MTAGEPGSPGSRRIAVVGAGAVGGYYGACLARAGEDVRFLMRRDLETVRRGGLRVSRSDGESFHLAEVEALGSTEEIGPVDLVLIAIKGTDNPALESLIPPLLHPETRLVTLQNGLGNEAFLAERFGAERVLGGLCFVCLNRTSPGVIEHLGFGAVTLSELRPSASKTGVSIEAVRAMFDRAGVPCRIAPDLNAARWTKLAWNIPFNGLAIATGGLDVGRILADPALVERVEALMDEVVGAAEALGLKIEPGLASRLIEMTRSMGAYRPSSLIDYEEGRAVEIETIWGEPLRQARAEAGVSCDAMDRLYRQIRRRLEERDGDPGDGGEAISTAAKDGEGGEG